jgi:hypothetical protein
MSIANRAAKLLAGWLLVPGSRPVSWEVAAGSIEDLRVAGVDAFLLAPSAIRARTRCLSKRAGLYAFSTPLDPHIVFTHGTNDDPIKEKEQDACDSETGANVQ